MQDIELQALKIYQNNLKYFEENHENLYKRISLLNALIEDAKYQEKYILEYKNEGYFDVQELSTNEWLYGENSVAYSKKIVDNTTFKRTGGVFKGHKLVSASKEDTEFIDKSELSFHNSLWATIKLINYINTYTPADSYMNRINKVIFLDIGLGLHIKEVIQKLSSQVVFIKEKNLELFRLSLFIINYEELAKSNFLYFSIAEDELEERETFISYLNQGNNYNLNMKHIPFNSEYPSDLRRLQGHVLTQSYVNYGYSAMLLRFIDSIYYLAHDYSFLNVNKFHNDNLLSDLPVLLLFSGPSTSKNMKWIQDNHERFIIVSALSTCRLLHKNGIKPDVVIHIDPGAETTALLFDGIDTEEYFKQTMVILASNVDKSTFERFNSSKVHFVEQGTFYKKGFGRLSAPSVGEYTYALFLIFGAQKIFLLGIDLALDNETFQTHGDSHAFNQKGEINNQDASLNPEIAIEFVKGNLLDKVPSNAGYKMSHTQFEVFSDELKSKTTTVYNLSNGAYLKGTEPLYIDKYDWNQIHVLNKETIHKQFIAFFKDIGESEFNEGDRKQIKYQIKEAKKLEKIIKKFQKKKFANVQVYLDAVGRLSAELSDMNYKSNSDLAQVYYEYFSIVLSYIFDLFNTKNLSTVDKHVRNVNTILLQQLLKISNLYISKLENYLK